MNVINLLCSPFLDALSENEAFDIVVPRNTDSEIDNVLENEMDDENVLGKKIKVVRQLVDPDGCKVYAQIMAVAAFVLELKSDGRTVSLRDVYYALKGLFRNQKECNAIILEVGRVLKLKRRKIRFQIQCYCTFPPLILTYLGTDEMNIVPASKGFVAGHLRFRFHTPPVEEEMEQNEEGKDEHEDESQPMDLAEPSTPAPAPASSSTSAGDVTSWCYAFEPSQNRASTSAASTTTGSGNNSAYTNNISSAPGAGAAGCSLIGAAWTSCPANYIEVEWLSETSAEPLWLLVVEKEGVFHRLLEERFPDRMKCIMVTGCGYPDMATRALVSKLSIIYSRMRVVGLCDYNPHGLALLLTYRFPSVSSEYESQGLQADIRWLGLRAVHIREFSERSTVNISNTTTSAVPTLAIRSASLTVSTNSSSTFAREQLQELTLADTRKIRALLNSMNSTAQELPLEYGQELHQMLLAGVKCEIESCYSLGLSFLPNFLERCMNNGDFI